MIFVSALNSEGGASDNILGSELSTLDYLNLSLETSSQHVRLLRLRRQLRRMARSGTNLTSSSQARDAVCRYDQIGQRGARGYRKTVHDKVGASCSNSELLDTVTRWNFYTTTQLQTDRHSGGRAYPTIQPFSRRWLHVWFT